MHQTEAEAPLHGAHTLAAVNAHQPKPILGISPETNAVKESHCIEHIATQKKRRGIGVLELAAPSTK